MVNRLKAVFVVKCHVPKYFVEPDQKVEGLIETVRSISWLYFGYTLVTITTSYSNSYYILCFMYYYSFQLLRLKVLHPIIILLYISINPCIYLAHLELNHGIILCVCTLFLEKMYQPVHNWVFDCIIRDVEITI